MVYQLNVVSKEFPRRILIIKEKCWRILKIPLRIKLIYKIMKN